VTLNVNANDYDYDDDDYDYDYDDYDYDDDDDDDDYLLQCRTSEILVIDFPDSSAGDSHVAAACIWPCLRMSLNHTIEQSQTRAFESNRL